MEEQLAKYLTIIEKIISSESSKKKKEVNAATNGYKKYWSNHFFTFPYLFIMIFLSEYKELIPFRYPAPIEEEASKKKKKGKTKQEE